MRTRVLGSTDDLEQEAWEQLTVGMGLGWTRGWLSYLERFEPSRGIVLVEGHGRLSAAATFFRTGPRTLALNDPVHLLTDPTFLRTHDLGPVEVAPPPRWLSETLLPALVVRNLDSSEIATDPASSPAEKRQAAAQVTAALEAHALALECRSLVFLYTPAQLLLTEVLKEHGFVAATVTALAEIPLQLGMSWEDWVARFPGHKRNKIRREMTAVADGGLTFGELPLPDAADRVGALEALTAERYGSVVDAERLAGGKRVLAECLGDRVRVVGCFRGKRLLGTAVDVVGNGVYHCLTYGWDYAAGNRTFAYQTMTFYAPVAYALREGLRSVWLGFESFQGKVERGAVLSPRRLHVKLVDGDETTAQRLAEWAALVDRRNRRYLGRWKMEEQA